jgi:hypothetical protein
MDKYPEVSDVKVGNIFILHYEDSKKKTRCILSRVRESEFCSISLETGNRWHDPFVVKKLSYGEYKFTKREIVEIFGRGFSSINGNVNHETVS